MNDTSLSNRLEQRLAELRGDLGEGERTLRELDERRERLVTSMLRVSGAIQVVEELLDGERQHEAACTLPT
jgi:hypothetical protein